MKEKTNLLEELKESSSTPSNEVRRFSGHREAISSKYAAIREQNSKPADVKGVEDMPSTKDSLPDAAKSSATNIIGVPSSSSIVSTWATMKSGFQNFKSNIGAKKFLPLRQIEDSKHNPSASSSSESLDDIFQRLRRPTSERGNHTEEGNDEMDS